MADVLGAFKQAVLIAVMRLQADAYGRAILKEVQARLGRDVAHGAVHATLGRLEQKTLLSSSSHPVRRSAQDERAATIGCCLPARSALNDARAAVDNIGSGLHWPLIKARSMA